MFSNPKCDLLRILWVKGKCHMNGNEGDMCKDLMNAVRDCEKRYY